MLENAEMVREGSVDTPCMAYDGDDPVCRDCWAVGVEQQQSCFREIKMEYKGDKVYRIIAQDGDVVVLKEVRSGQ